MTYLLGLSNFCCDDEVEDDVEESEDSCTISDDDDNECLCLDMLKWWVILNAK